MTVLASSILYYIYLSMEICQSLAHRFSGCGRNLRSSFAGAKVRQLFHLAKSFCNFFQTFFCQVAKHTLYIVCARGKTAGGKATEHYPYNFFLEKTYKPTQWTSIRLCGRSLRRVGFGVGRAKTCRFCAVLKQKRLYFRLFIVTFAKTKGRKQGTT